MQKIEVKILNTAFFQLLLEDFRRVIAAVDDLMAGVLGGKVVAVPGVFLEDTANDPLGLAAVVGIGRVKIVDTVADSIAGHFPDLFFVDAAVGSCGQTHGAEAQ